MEVKTMLPPIPCLRSEPKAHQSLDSEHGTDGHAENVVVSPPLSPELNSGNEIDLSVSCRITTMSPVRTAMRKCSTMTGEQTKSRKENFPTIKLENADHLPTSRRTHKIKACKLQLQTSFPNTQATISSVLSKRTKNETAMPSSSSRVFDREYWNMKSPEELGLLSSLIGSKGTKRSRRTMIDLWRPGNVDNINLDFSGLKSIMLRTKLEDRNVAGHNSHNKILDIESVSPNLTGTVQNEDRKDIASCNRAIFSLSEKALVSLDTLAIFPQTELSIEVEHVRKSLHKIMPLEIIQHISEDSSRCPAWTAKGCRCRNKHSTGPIISSIRKLPSLEMNGLLPQIQSLINSTLCSTHRKVAFREIERWKADFANLTTVQGPRDSSFSLHDWRLLAIASWIRLMSKDVAPQTEKSAPPLPKINTEPGSKIQQINPIQVFKPYITTARAEKLAEDIMKLVKRPLLPSEINQAGFIYIFWQVGNFGHMKIGRSTDVGRRLKEWEKQCKKKIDVHFPDMKAEEDHEDLQQIPHICRVEALVHMELLEHRRIEKKCPGCSKSHKEYFEISKEIAIQVVRKWVGWMRSLPYERRTIGGKDQWVLKNEHSKHLADLCRPLGLTPTSRSSPDKERIASLRPRLSLPSTARNEGRRRARKTL